MITLLIIQIMKANICYLYNKCKYIKLRIAVISGEEERIGRFNSTHTFFLLRK